MSKRVGIASGKMRGKAGDLTAASVQQAKEDLIKIGVISDEVPTRFDSPESSNILSGTYDPNTLQMVVTFRNYGANGGQHRLYDYENVDEALWTSFVQAASKGRFFAEWIRPFFIGKAHEP